MRLLAKLLVYVFINAIALVAASRLVAGFELQSDFTSVLTVAALLTAIHLVVRPPLHLLLSPLIVLTFGLAAIALNAFLLHLLDIWSTKLTITGTLPLFYATLIVGVVNIVLGAIERPLFHKNSY